MSDEAASPVTMPEPTWRVVGYGLISAALLILVGGAAYASVGDAAARERIETFSSIGGSIVTAALALGAILALIEAARRAPEPAALRPAFIVVFAIAITIVVFSVFSVLNLATMKIEQDSFSTSLQSIGDGGWKVRLAAILPRVAGGVVAGVAMVLANRRAPVSGSPASEALPPG